MARFNKINRGPFTKATVQVRELLASAALLPGCLLVITSGKFALAGATTVGKVWLAQDNYLAMKGVDVAWAQDSIAVGIEMEDDALYAGRIPTGTNITAIGTPLTPGANGKLAIAGVSDLIVGYANEVYNNNTGADQLIEFRASGSQSYLSAAS